MKNFLILTITVLISLVNMVGCSASTNSTTASPTKLTYWTFDNMYAEYMQHCVKTFNETSLNTIELEISIYSKDELDYKLWSSLQAGVATPDMVDIELNRFERYMNPKNNYLAPINTIIDQRRNSLLPNTYKKYQSKGFFYGIDYYEGNCVVFYNTEILHSAGIRPEDIVTLEDYINAGVQLKNSVATPLLAVDYTDDKLTAIMYSLLSTKSNEDKKEALLNTLVFIDSLLVENAVATTAPGGDYFGYEFYNFFNSGNAASIIAPYWYSQYIKAYMPSLAGKIYVAPLPAPLGYKNSGVISGGVATAIPISSENAILTKRLLIETRLTAKETVNSFLQMGADPVISEGYELLNDYTEKFFTNNPLPLLQEIRKNPYYNIEAIEYNKASQKLVDEILYWLYKEKSITPAQALALLEE